jgi:hypothetical protein
VKFLPRALGATVLTSTLIAAAISVSALPASAARGGPVVSEVSAGVTLSFAPTMPSLGQAISYVGGGCAPEENVIVTLSYAPYAGAATRSDLVADGAGNFSESMPMFGDPDLQPPGTGFILRADCGVEGQTDPDRFATAAGTLGDPATPPTMVVRLSPDPVNPGAHLGVEGVGCSADDLVTFSTDDPALRVTTRSADSYGTYWALIPTNAAAAPGTPLAVTVICGPTTPPVDADRIWTGSVTYSGTPADVPTAQPDEVTMNQGTVLTIDPLANDTGRDARISWVEIAEHGTAVIAPDGLTIEYTPDPDFIGVERFQYSIDNLDGTAGAIISVTVLPAPTEEPLPDDADSGPGADETPATSVANAGTGTSARLAETGGPHGTLLPAGGVALLLVGAGIALARTGIRSRAATVGTTRR